MLNKYSQIKTFDTLTQFRITNALLVMLGIYLILPVLVDLRGELLSTTFISLIFIATTLAVKSNKYFVENYSLSQLYKFGIFVHFLFLLGGFLYFIDPLYFVIVDSFISILEMSILSSYSIKLDVYQAKNFPQDVEPFKIFRNTSIADATLLGLGTVALISYFFSIDVSILIFIIFNTVLSFYLFSNWNFYNNFFIKENSNEDNK